MLQNKNKEHRCTWLMIRWTPVSGLKANESLFIETEGKMAVAKGLEEGMEII